MTTAPSGPSFVVGGGGERNVARFIEKPQSLRRQLHETESSLRMGGKPGRKFLISTMHAKCSTQLIFIDFIA
jgi:hypothetical protein